MPMREIQKLFACFAVNCLSLPVDAQQCPAPRLTLTDAGTGQAIDANKVALGQAVTATIPAPDTCCSYKDIQWTVTAAGAIVVTQNDGLTLSWTAPLDNPPQGGNGFTIHVKGKKKYICRDGGGADVWEDWEDSVSGTLFCACGFGNCSDSETALCGCGKSDQACPCGGGYCSNKTGAQGGTDASCQRQCKQANQTACGAAKQADGTWNSDGKKLCRIEGCGFGAAGCCSGRTSCDGGCGNCCNCGFYYCRNSTATAPTVHAYPCATQDGWTPMACTKNNTGGATATLTVTANPDWIPSDGQTGSTITATLTDATGAPMANEIVSLSTTVGTLSAPSAAAPQMANQAQTLTVGCAPTVNVTTNQSGQAIATLTATDGGNATVTAYHARSHASASAAVTTGWICSFAFGFSLHPCGGTACPGIGGGFLSCMFCKNRICGCSSPTCKIGNSYPYCATCTNGIPNCNGVATKCACVGSGNSCNCPLHCPATESCSLHVADCPCGGENCPRLDPQHPEQKCGTGMCKRTAANPVVGDQTPCGAVYKNIVTNHLEISGWTAGSGER